MHYGLESGAENFHFFQRAHAYPAPFTPEMIAVLNENIPGLHLF